MTEPFPFVRPVVQKLYILGVLVKSAAVTLLAAFIVPSTAFAGSSQVHAFIGPEQKRVKVTTSEVIWSSNLENTQINDNRIEKSGTFMLRCGADGKQYVMISVPLVNDVWSSQSEDLHTKADVAAFGSDLEISGADLLSMQTGTERVMYVDLEGKVSDFVRHWSTGRSVRVSVHPGHGLNDLSFIVAASVPDADSEQKMAKAAALCQMLAG